MKGKLQASTHYKSRTGKTSKTKDYEGSKTLKVLLLSEA